MRRVYADVETSRDRGITVQIEGQGADLWPVYGGDSFDLWQPDTGQYYALGTWGAHFKLVQR